MTNPNNNNLPAQAPQRALSPVDEWKTQVMSLSRRAVGQILGGERAKEASGRIMLALSAAQSLNPAIVNCTMDSVARCIAQATLTGIMPGGSSPKAYLVPKSPGRGQPPELNYWVTHRGLLEFARRAGWVVQTTLVGTYEQFELENDEIRHKPDPDRIPKVVFVGGAAVNELRGIIVRAFPVDNPAAKVHRWIPLATLDERRLKSDTKAQAWSPWNQWPLEMYEKTAIKYAAGRGVFNMDDEAEYADDESTSARIVEAWKQTGYTPALTHEPAARVHSFDDVAQAVGATPSSPPDEAQTVTVDPDGATMTLPPRE